MRLFSKYLRFFLNFIEFLLILGIINIQRNQREESVYMLIDFSFSNYRAFKETSNLSMLASSQTTYNDILIRSNGKRILPSAVIYGSNAGGKSSVVSALNVFSNIVRIGSISEINNALRNIELCPFAHDDDELPICFKADFINDGYRLCYAIDFYTGKFVRNKRKISAESLSIIEDNGTVIQVFKREFNNVYISKDRKALALLEVEKDYVNSIEKRINDNMDSLELFLSRGFKSGISAKIADLVIDFFTSKVFVVEDFSLLNAVINVESDVSTSKKYAVWNYTLEKFVKAADFGPQEIRYVSDSNPKDSSNSDMQLRSFYHSGDVNYAIPAELMESRGTIKLLDFAIPFLNFFSKGGVFVLDEFDASLHPELIKGIISLFNNSEKNKKGAQLIFTTHNPIYLNNKLFRRDQIRFVEKDADTYKSVLYSLADFGSEQVRNDENYLINYFKGKYTSLPYIDFSSLIGDDSA